MASNNSREGDREFMARLRRERDARMQGYRERALRMFPPVCGRCGREFEGKRLRELTVHHRDHDHDNNPPDGSNWELLCVYCHDNEHSRHSVADWSEGPAPEGGQSTVSTYNPFAGLDKLIRKKPK
ncbi:MAG TPA: YajD family HNH nuclease [Acidobacteriota bacterium]|nr:YajD family HNH nuclease [Acidobacteriota bacterium]